MLVRLVRWVRWGPERDIGATQANLAAEELKISKQGSKWKYNDNRHYKVGWKMQRSSGALRTMVSS